jgi:hypothetical protein
LTVLTKNIAALREQRGVSLSTKAITLARGGRIANAGDSDQKVPMTQEASIANNDLFTVAELPTTRAQHDHHLAAI